MMHHQKNVRTETRNYLIKDVLITLALTGMVTLLIFLADHSNSSDCHDGVCDPWTWFLVDLLFTLEGATGLVAVAALLDMIAQGCECCYWRKRQSRGQGILNHFQSGADEKVGRLGIEADHEESDDMLRHHNLCDTWKDKLHKILPCVNERRDSSSLQRRCTWWSRLLLCLLDVVYNVIFVLHTAVRFYSGSGEVDEDSFIAGSSRWAYLLYLFCDICFAVWIFMQLLSVRGYKTYVSQVFSSLGFVCGWVGTMCSIIMCIRRLDNTSSDGNFFELHGSEELPPPYSLAFLRIAYVEVLVRKTLDEYLKRMVDDFTGQIIRIALGSAVFLFMASAALYTSEGLGDPDIISSSIRANEYVNEWHMLSAVYWSIVTMTTVGYGDMYPSTMIGKFLAMGVIVLGISFLGDVIGKLGDLRKTIRLGRELYTPRLSNRRHIVICGPIDKLIIEELLAQMFNESIKHAWDLDIGGLEVVIMVPRQVYDSDIRRWLARSSAVYDSRVAYVSGDIMNTTDAKRARLASAAACFMFPGPYSGENQDEDTVVRAMQVHQRYGSRVMLYIMLHSTKLKGQLIHSRIPRDRILCLDQIKFKLAASAAAVPGSANLLLNLLTFSTLAESRQRIFGGAAASEPLVSSGDDSDSDPDDVQAHVPDINEEAQDTEKESISSEQKTKASNRQPSNLFRRMRPFKLRRARLRRGIQFDRNIELHVKGATQQFLECQRPVSGVLVGRRFSAVARDLYRQRRVYEYKRRGRHRTESTACNEDDQTEFEDSDSDEDAEPSMDEDVRRAGLFNRSSRVLINDGTPEADSTPVLLCGVHTIDSNGVKRLIMAPPKTYRLQAGDYLFFIGDDLEEVTRSLHALRRDYKIEELRRSASVNRIQHDENPRVQEEQKGRRVSQLHNIGTHSYLSQSEQIKLNKLKMGGILDSVIQKQHGDYAQKQLLSTWLGTSDRRDYLCSIMYTIVSAPVTIQLKEEIPNRQLAQCQSEIDDLKQFLGDRENALGRGSLGKSHNNLVGESKLVNESSFAQPSRLNTSQVDRWNGTTTVQRTLIDTVNSLSLNISKASKGGVSKTCQICAMRKVDIGTDFGENAALSEDERERARRENIIDLNGLPIADARQFIRFKLRAPLKSRLHDHVVICNCDLAVDGHLIIEYFAERRMKKLLFLCPNKPAFSVWGSLVTMRSDCEVYFVVGNVTDVAALQNCNISEAMAMIILFPKNRSSQRSRSAGRLPGSSTDYLGDDNISREAVQSSLRQDRNQRQDQATKLVEKHFLYQDDEHNCDLMSIPAFCELCNPEAGQNCNIDMCQSHSECRNCSDHFKRHPECRRHFNPRLSLSLITEMSRLQGIRGDAEYNRSEAAGKLFSEIDFVSILAVRFHFSHFITLAFRAIEGVRQREVHSDWLSDSSHNTYGEMLLTLLRKHGIVVVGLLRFPHMGSSPLVLTNPPAGTKLIEGDQFFYYNGGMSVEQEDAEEHKHKWFSEERERRRSSANFSVETSSPSNTLRSQSERGIVGKVGKRLLFQSAVRSIIKESKSMKGHRKIVSQSLMLQMRAMKHNVDRNRMKR